MNDKIDIFDTADLSYLPDGVRQIVGSLHETREGRGRTGSKYEVLLHEAGRPLHAKELMAAVWRKHGVGPRSLNSVYTSLGILVSRGA